MTRRYGYGMWLRAIASVFSLDTRTQYGPFTLAMTADGHSPGAGIKHYDFGMLRRVDVCACLWGTQELWRYALLARMADGHSLVAGIKLYDCGNWIGITRRWTPLIGMRALGPTLKIS